MDSSTLRPETDEEYSLVLQTAGEDRLVVVDFYADWCGPCKIIGPTVESLAKFYTHVTFVKVNTDMLRATSAAASVKGIPAFHFYRNGRLLEQFAGADVTRLQNTVSLHAGLSPEERKKQEEEKSPYKYFPLKTYVTFKDPKALPKIESKILEVNQGMENKLLSDAEITALKSFIARLQDTTMWHGQEFNQSDYDLILKLVTRLPTSQRFPTIDLASLLVHHPHGAQHYVDSCFSDKEDNLFDIFLASLLDEQITSVVGNSLTIWRFIANSFHWPQSRRCIYELFDMITDAAQIQIKHSNKIIRAAVAAVMLNLCVCGKEYNDTGKLKQVVTLLAQTLTDEHPAVVAYALQGLGTALFRQSDLVALSQSCTTLQNVKEDLLSDESKQMLSDLRSIIN